MLLLFNCSAMFDSLWPYGLQHVILEPKKIKSDTVSTVSLSCHICQDSLPCPSLSSGVCSNSYPLSRWCHPTISSSVAPFSSCLQSFPASESSLRSQLFTSGGQGIGASSSLLVLLMNIQDWFDLLAVQGTLKSLLQHHSSKASILGHSAFFMVQLSHPYITTGKTIALTMWLCVCTSIHINIYMGCHFLLKRIFLTQGSNPGLLHCRQMLYCLSYQGWSKYIYIW